MFLARSGYWYNINAWQSLLHDGYLVEFQCGATSYGSGKSNVISFAWVDGRVAILTYFSIFGYIFFFAVDTSNWTETQCTCYSFYHEGLNRRAHDTATGSKGCGW